MPYTSDGGTRQLGGRVIAKMAIIAGKVDADLSLAL
jgi:hypothetical protein